jgi:hypothetical protein
MIESFYEVFSSEDNHDVSICQLLIPALHVAHHPGDNAEVVRYKLQHPI